MSEEKTFAQRIHDIEVDRIFKEMIYDDLLHNRMHLAVGKDCPLCLKREREVIGKMRLMVGPYGKFLSCNQYPLCRFSWNSPSIVGNENQDTELEVNV